MLALILAVPLAPRTPLVRPAAAPEAHFALKGTVLDPSRAPVAAARVVAVSIDQRLTPSTQTDGRGEFELLLAPGTYSVRVTASGFLQGEQSVTALDTGSDSREFVLKLAPFGETVTVNAGREYAVAVISSATRTPTRLLDVPQAITVTSKELVRDQLMLSLGDVMRYTPGISVHQGENNRDQVVIRGQSSSADFFLNGVRDDVQYYRDLYNLERVEALKGPNAMIFGRGGGGGVVNRVTKEALFQPVREATLQGGGYGHKRVAGDFDQPLNDTVAVRLNAMYESSDSFRDSVELERYGVNPTLTIAAGTEHAPDARLRAPPRPARSPTAGSLRSRGCPRTCRISTYYGNPDDSRVRADVDLASATRRAPGGRAHAAQPHALRRLRPRLPELRAGSREREPDAGHAHRLQQRDAAGQPVQPGGRDLLAHHGPREAHAARRASSSACRTPTTSGTPASSATRRRRSRCPTRARPSRRR